MRVLIQRVKHASVTIDGALYSEIQQGYVLLVGITTDDTKEISEKLAKKVAQLRIFEDEDGKMNFDIQQVGGSILSISQFTLYADTKKGNRPGFSRAARPEQANPLYEMFNEQLRTHGLHVKTGVFGADMKVELCNDGPVTIMLDSEEMYG
ncbi:MULTISPECIES: D-aminoacyl-tRNA deacylase [unclassified Breznakia]|uniref:D-aminoacyl-tRNA deacylase n=1 Tax=unclassified Breznakia TaxID=2623764 RepID=UPI0024746C73|nr:MULTISPECIES: D-aminoacyl-tRNA deacylase [unclassified Breznakia]MDH6367280.1 D-tyrosyl-tRNA(Tyr) deacylase [Breznakia sp. PH1-1]MDH6404459.1 D-tyrosyl-tRNA(Tyr) deacylase [Breznakia sp. PF1-11]MDH6412150.1 D-tyrosyl-tRNA(Tyr) deacylase [Breznakia sp. PFB1-11]MDH6414447.1 D-tyrosyl-tRNA(Tyr) deacylase [Breznakia sp. PFB1-14]MDH6416832.1 D-tyrosyl-tRNA(Tyr) deacylase [Breznakia sp. PFB1-4]